MPLQYIQMSRYMTRARERARESRPCSWRQFELNGSREAPSPRPLNQERSLARKQIDEYQERKEGSALVGLFRTNHAFHQIETVNLIC